MTTVELITALFYHIDQQMHDMPKHPEAHLWPSKVMTLGLLHALKGVGNRPFSRWLMRDYRALWHWFSLMGICFPFPMNRLCHLHVENFTHRQPPFDHAQIDSGDVSGHKMDAKKIVDHPIDM